jgi:hypothetical protein
MTGWGRIAGGGEDGERVDKRGQKEELGGRTMDCRRRESEGNTVEKIVMMKLIQKERKLK